MTDEQKRDCGQIADSMARNGDQFGADALRAALALIDRQDESIMQLECQVGLLRQAVSDADVTIWHMSNETARLADVCPEYRKWREKYGGRDAK